MLVIGSATPLRNFTVDHKVPQSKGGGTAFPSCRVETGRRFTATSTTVTGNGFDPAELSEALRSLIEALPDNESDLSGIKASRRSKLRLEIGKVIERLSNLSRRIDPIAQPPVVFDPSDPDTVGKLIAMTMLEQERIPLSLLWVCLTRWPDATRRALSGRATSGV